MVKLTDRIVNTNNEVGAMLSVFTPVHSISRIMNSIYSSLLDYSKFSEDELRPLSEGISKTKILSKELYPFSDLASQQNILEIYSVANEADALLKELKVTRGSSQYISEFSNALAFVSKLVNNLDSHIMLALNILIKLDLNYRKYKKIDISYGDRGKPLSHYQIENLLSDQALALVKKEVSINDFILYIKKIKISPSKYAGDNSSVVIELYELIEEFCLTVEINELIDFDSK